MGKDTVRNYFEEFAKYWIETAYDCNGYDYPVGYHRTRIAIEVLSELNRPIKVVDLGCGGGNLAIALAKKGHTVTGIDQSAEMIEQAESVRKGLSFKARERIRFICGSLEKNKLDKNAFDAVTAMGIIYYLPADDIFFNIVNQLLKPGGLLLVSCRNRLFNMVSITYRTRKEIESGNALALISELEELYKAVSPEDTDRMISELKRIVAELPDKVSYDRKEKIFPLERNKIDPRAIKIEPRQYTPKQFLEIAKKFGFEHNRYYGIHPHFTMPCMNLLFQPEIFNKLSGCLEALEHLPVSLCWSSHFLGVFKKQNRKTN